MRIEIQIGYLPLKKIKKNIQIHVVTFEPVSGRPRQAVALIYNWWSWYV